MDVGSLVNEQYKIIEHIGRGGMADVWSARDTRLRRMVAIKTIVSGLSKDLDPVELFKREAHTIAQMEHPHILPIYDFGEFENNLYIVMRYVTGGSLEDMLRDGPLSPEDTLRMGDAIGKALDYAHTNNVIHLDLKPPNILLDSSESPYLADFGLATVLDPEGRARNPGSGTLLYMAPEQMMSETIDHRADIYSFCIMLFHMLTGTLPFDGSVPLSMSQLQRDIGLPNLTDYISYLPHDLTELLRLGTTEDPKLRPKTHMEIMEQFRDIVQPAGITVATATFNDEYSVEIDPHNMSTELYEGDLQDADLLEAIDIYTRARYDWQGGQGRFLLGVTNFILMSDYYMNASQYNLTIDTAGYQVLLRGAIEYDHEVEYWWQRLGSDDRRWVCLHALRSGNTPARIRALYRLETLPDQDGTAVIPRLVAQALEVETDDNAKLAALKVLGTRVRLMKKRPKVKIMTEYQGRLITSMTRLGIEISKPDEWQETAYSEDVDVLVAEQSFDSSPHVAEFAARTVGKIRSLAAVSHLAREQLNKRNGALQALAYVRDEAPSLPDVVNREGRFYAWMTNTVRRLTENPWQLIANVALVFIMGWIAMGNHIWSFIRVTVGSLGPARWSNTIALGVIFGLMMSLTYVVTVVTSERLRGFWSWWMRLLVSGILGFAIAILSFASYRYLFLLEAPQDIAWNQMRFAGAALAFGLVATTFLRLRPWEGVIITAVSTFIPIFATYSAYYFSQESTIVPIAIIALLLGIFCGWRASQLTGFEMRYELIQLPIVSVIVGVVLGVLWTTLVWAGNFTLLARLNNGNTFTWDTVLISTTVHIMAGFILAYWLNTIGRVSLALTAIVTFIGAYAVFSWQFFDYSFSVPFLALPFEVMYSQGTALLPASEQPIIIYDFDRINQIYTITLPMVIVVALGMNMPNLLSNWSQWIGSSRTPKVRGAWMTATLGYVMVITALISILALYSPEINRYWELAWSGWAFVTFILTLATFRWAKWGADGLLLSGIVVLFASIVFDGVAMYTQALDGLYPYLLSEIPQLASTLNTAGIQVAVKEIHIWGIWAMVLAIFVWGAQRRLLWGAIGLVTLIVAWYLAVFTGPLRGSVAVFVATHVALVAYVIQSKYDLFEVSRSGFRQLASQGNEANAVPETLIDLPDMPLPLAPATQILPADAEAVGQREMPDSIAMDEQSTDDRHPIETIDLNIQTADEADTDDKFEMETALTPELNTDDLYTKFPRESEFVMMDTEPDSEPSTGFKINLDTSTLKAGDEDVDDNRTQLAPNDTFKVNLDTSSLRQKQPKTDKPTTEFKVNLDTSSLRQTKPKDDESDDTDDETPSGKSQVTDIKINLDTSTLKTEASETETEPRTTPKPVFKFDSAQIVENQQTVQFEKDDDSAEEDEDE